jgi:hypothetical protein
MPRPRCRIDVDVVSEQQRPYGPKKLFCLDSPDTGLGITDVGGTTIISDATRYSLRHSGPRPLIRWIYANHWFQSMRRSTSALASHVEGEYGAE